MGHSLMIVGCLMGMDVRICGPKSLWPSDEYTKIARDLEKKYGATLTITDDVTGGGEGCRLHSHRRVGVDGRAEGSVEAAHRSAAAVSGQRRS